MVGQEVMRVIRKGEEMKDLFIPARRYHPPNGEVEEGAISVPNGYTVERAAQLKRIEDAGLFFTIEIVLGSMVSICLDDKTFDYRTALVANNVRVIETAVEFIDEFNIDDYRRARADSDAVSEREAESPQWSPFE